MRRWNHAACLAAGVLGLALAAPRVRAQEAAPGDAAAAPAAAQVQNVTLWGMWKTGGAFMYPIGLLSVAALALTVYGFLLTRENKMLQMHLVPSLQDAIGRLDFGGASTSCAANPGVMTNILNAGLTRLADDPHDIPSMEKAMEEAAVEETAAGLKPINYLSIIASVAPMFGLLGTVSGMIKAFQKIGLGGMGKPELLAADIGEAMITTAFGLLIGIPAMFFYFYLKSRFQSHMARIGRILGNLTHHLGVTMRKVANGELDLEAATTAGRAAPDAPPAAP